MPKPRTSRRGRLATLTLAALGVVYGDIGTSPLYALKEVFGGAHHPVPIDEANVLGILSLVFWALMIVVSIKYIVFIMRANNKGEGGIMALMALVLRGEKDPVARAVPDADGAVRRGALLRRRPDHAGDLGALRRRGPRGRHARVQALRHPDHADRPGRAVRRSRSAARAASARCSAPS